LRQSKHSFTPAALGVTAFFLAACGAGKTHDPLLAGEKIAEASYELSVGDPMKAHVLLREARELDPEAERLHLLTGDTYLAMERLEAAEEAYRLAIAEAPDDPTPLNNLAVVYREQGYTNDAHRLFEEVLEEFGPDVDVEHNLGLIALEQERWNDAIELFEGVVEKDETYAPAHYGLSLAYDRVGRELDSKRAQWRFERER